MTPKRTKGRQDQTDPFRPKDSGTDRRPLVVVNMSGGTGRTVDQVLQAALAQFERPPVQVVHRAHIHNERVARQIVREAAKDGSVIVHSLVSPDIRTAVIQEAERQQVPTVDILGPVLNVLTDRLELKPHNVAGLSYQLHKEQFDRIDSVDFTLAHDDGARLKTLADADVVLVGVSRVAKSVTSFYLAYRGIRVANVPIILNSELPAEVTSFDPRRVIGLTMNLNRLLALRSTRMGAIGYGSVLSYTERQQVLEELRYASRLMLKHKWNCIDVSYLSIEEVAAEVIRFMEGDTSHGP